MLQIMSTRLGLIAKFFARTFTRLKSRNVIVDFLLGVTGALVGSWIFNYFGAARIAELGQENILIEVIGAAALLVLFQAASSSGQ